MSTSVIPGNPVARAKRARRGDLFFAPASIIALVAAAALIPMLFLGLPSGHDFEFHLNSWMEVVGQWKQGIAYPRWASGAHFGFGEARFIFYPPGSWLLGALLGLVLPWPLVPPVYVWIVLLLAGISSFYLARQFLSRRAAAFAGAAYAVNPYHLVIVYWRSAFAELLASCLLPWLLLFLLRLDKPGKKTTLALALIIASAWLADAPVAVMINYSLALIVVVLAVLRRSPRIITYGASAVLLGASLAAFYLLPAAYEEKWVNIAEVLSPGLRPADNFLFTSTVDPDHNRFNLLVSLVALAEMVWLAVLGYFLWQKRNQYRQLFSTLVAWAAASLVLMFSPSLFLWQHLPKLRFVQLPWRWLLCLNVAFALFTTLAPRHLRTRAAVSASMLLLLLLVWFRVQPPWFDSVADIAEMHDNIEEGRGYEGTDEYVPAGADAYEIKQSAPKIVGEGGGGTRLEIERWEAESKLFTVTQSQPSTIVLRLFNYPAWQVQVNDRRVPIESEERTGQAVIAVPAGVNRVQVSFVRTWDRTLGGLVSLIALASILALARFDTKERGTPPILIATSNPGKLRDFSAAARAYLGNVQGLPDFAALPLVVEDGLTFEANAQKKAEFYSRFVPGQLVVADDSGIEIDALHGAPGVHSARYAAQQAEKAQINSNSDDEANNARVLRELKGVPPDQRTARFVCVLAAARNGSTIATFRGEAEGLILDKPRGRGGFGYDPLFYFPSIEKTFAELDPEEKARYSHRGAAFRKFLEWCDRQA